MDWNRVESLFEQARAMPAAEVGPFLEQACDDPEARGLVLDLLSESEAAPHEFLRGLVGGGGAPTQGDAQEPAAGQQRAAGQRIGGFTIDRELGRGGMGVVYLARRSDGQYEQLVALKIVAAIGDWLDRFKQERQILARLVHPNIVRLLDGGTTPDGLPYLAMEYVEGSPITEYCDKLRLTAPQRCELMIPVCDAVAYAHKHLIVHRDIKPGNILVASGGVPKLLDFGIAKLLDPTGDTELTNTAYRPLTPGYASPEQLASGTVTTATDVYQLGAVLYRLLTGRMPSEAAKNPAEGEAGWIAAKAMHEDPDRRYGSVQELAADLRNLAEHRPVQARGDSLSYRFRKWIRRSPALAAALTFAAVSLFGGTVATWYQARRAEQRFQQVRVLAGTFVFEFDDKIKDLVGSTSARAFVVQTAIRYLDSLKRDAAGDLDLLMELSAAYATVGVIQGSPSGANLGKTDEAIASFDKAIGAAREVLSARPDHREALRCLVHALSQKGLIFLFNRRDRKGISALLDEATSRANALAAYPDSTPAELRVIAVAYKSLGESLAHSPKAAIPHFERAVATMERLRREAPASTAETDVALIGAMVNLARVQRDTGNSPEWVRMFEKAETILRSLHDKDPTKESVRRQLWIILTGLGTAYGARLSFHVGQPEKAVAVLKRAMTLAEAPRLAPFESALERGHTSSHLAQASSGSQALAYIEGARSAAAEMERLDPRSGAARTLRLNLDLTAAFTLLEMSRPLEAWQTALAVIAKAREDLRSDASNLAALDILQQCLTIEAHAALALRDWSIARRAADEAWRSASSAVAKDPTDLYFLQNLARAAEVSGDLKRAQSDEKGALEDYRKALESWRKWRELAPWGPYPEPFISAVNAKINRR